MRPPEKCCLIFDSASGSPARTFRCDDIHQLSCTVHHIPSHPIQAMKKGVKELLSGAHAFMKRQFGPLLIPGKQEEADTLMESALNIFDGLQTEKQEYATIKQHLGGVKATSAWMEPTLRKLVDPTGERTEVVVCPHRSPLHSTPPHSISPHSTSTSLHLNPVPPRPALPNPSISHSR
jgi:hypothetical protein